MGLIAFSLGDAVGYLYGCIVMAAVLAGLLAAWIAVRLRHEDFSVVLDLLLWGLPVGIFAARFGYVLGHWQLYSGHLSEILNFGQGGISLYGGAIGFLLTAAVYCRWHGLSLWHWLDVLAPALLLGMAVNELGIFFTQMTVGAPLPPDLPNDHTLVEYIDFRYRPSGFEDYQYFKPIALYQAGMQLVVLLLAVLLSVVNARWQRLAAGGIFLLSMAAIGFIRFACGFSYLSALPHGSLHGGQILALTGAALCLLLFLVRQYRNRRRSWYRGGRW